MALANIRDIPLRLGELYDFVYNSPLAQAQRHSAGWERRAREHEDSLSGRASNPRPAIRRRANPMAFRPRRVGGRARTAAAGMGGGGSSVRRRRVSRRRPKGRRSTKKVKRKRRTLAGRTGTVKKVVENGGTVTQSDVAYIGVYSSPVVQVVESVVRALYRALLSEAGIDFSSWTERHRFHGFVSKTFIHFETQTITSTPPSGTLLPFSSTDVLFDNVAGNETHDQMCQKVILKMWEIVESGVPITLQEFQLFSTYLDSSEAFIVERRHILAELRPKQLKVSIVCSNKLEIQNRTKAADTGVAVADQINETALNVANNPVVGYLYTTKGSTFKPRADDYGRAEYALYAELKYGLIKSSALGGNVLVTVQEELFNYVKPPLPSFFQKATGKRITLAPGAMTQTTAVYKKTIPVNDLFAMYLPTMQIYNSFVPLSTSLTYPYMFGESKMFALERKLDSRDSSDNQLVNIGYEHTINIESRILKVKSFLAPLNEIVT